MNNYYPLATKSSILLDSLWKSEKMEESKHMSDRMVKMATLLGHDEHIGWQMYVPTKGMAEISLFGSESIAQNDLEWIAEKMGSPAKRSQTKANTDTLTELYELFLPIVENRETTTTFGLQSNWKSDCKSKWPNAFFTQFEELIKALRMEGAAFRVVLGSADVKEVEKCQKNTLSTYDLGDRHVTAYLGRPVRARVLFLLPQKPSIRLRSVLECSITGSSIRFLGNVKNKEIQKIWNHPLENATVLPELAAKVMILEPIAKESILGVEVREEEVKPLPASHKNSSSKKAVTIGKAMTTSGIQRNITLADLDLRRHVQIVGQTGTGKSTLLANTIISAIENGYGLTFFDPHGTTIDVILHSLPKKYADRVRVARLGDVDNPVPLKIWDSPDPMKEEKNISQLCEIFTAIFDPYKQGWVGPRYHRWLSTFAKASIAFLKEEANFESICVLSQNKDNMLKLGKAIIRDYPELVDIIRYEYGTDSSSDFVNTINWYMCKFQSLTSIPQLRNTLGAPVNAIDFKKTLDTDTVNLIDLASPVMGSNASRILGTLLLMKLWDAAQTRQNRDMTHLVVVDEASLFQAEPMPSMLGQARKYGISMILCHQHTDQLSAEIKDALEANSASFCAFRLSAKDARNAAIRFDDDNLLNSMTRLNAFNAVTTLSVDGKQTDPFTLQISKPRKQKDADLIAEYIEKHSKDVLVEPYRMKKAITRKEVQDRLNEAAKAFDEGVSEKGREERHEERKSKRPDWVDKYLSGDPA